MPSMMPQPDLVVGGLLAPNTHTARSPPYTDEHARGPTSLQVAYCTTFCSLSWQYLVVVVVEAWLLLGLFPVLLWYALYPPTAVPANLPGCLSGCLLASCLLPYGHAAWLGFQHDGGGEPLPGHLQQFLLRALQHHPLPQQEGSLCRKIGGECARRRALCCIIYCSVMILTTLATCLPPVYISLQTWLRLSSFRGTIV